MNVIPLSEFRDGPFIVEGQIHVDERGEFRTIQADSVVRQTYGQIPPFKQTNLVRGVKGALRGFHAGSVATNHWKAVTCVKGEVLEAFLDLREGSATFGNLGTHLAKGELNQLILVPPGFGHGMQSLTDQTLSIYSTTVEYIDQQEIDISPLSPELSELWMLPYVISQRDINAPHLKATRIN